MTAMNDHCLWNSCIIIDLSEAEFPNLRHPKAVGTVEYVELHHFSSIFPIRNIQIMMYD